jgi:hypothetical protein
LLVAEKGDAVLALLEQSDDRFRFKAEIGSILEQAAVELSAPAGERPDLSTEAGARLVVLLKQLRSLYTMQQERDLHDARIKAWGL